LTSAAYDRLAGGFYNMGLISSGNPGGLAGPGAWRENWPKMQADIAVVIGEGAMSAAAAQAAAAAAFSAPNSKATSTTEIAMPALDAAVNVPIVEPDRLYAVGQTASVAVTADGAKGFSGPIIAWNPGSKVLQVRVKFVAGAGTYSAWTIALTAPVDATLTGRVAALEIANTKLRAQALFRAKEFIG